MLGRLVRPHLLGFGDLQRGIEHGTRDQGPEGKHSDPAEFHVVLPYGVYTSLLFRIAITVPKLRIARRHLGFAPEPLASLDDVSSAK